MIARATVAFAMLAFCVAACSQPTDKTASAAPSAAVAPASAPTAGKAVLGEAWIGRWSGVEGNFLLIESIGTPGVYAITEGTLDGVKRRTGRARAAGIDFVDGDKIATIHAGTGKDTGLKDLAEKTDCLVIEDGRGFCR